MQSFKYSREWYENEAHAELKNPDYEPNPASFHPERDKKCLTDLGVLPEHSILVCGCGGGDNIWLLDKEFGCRNVTGIDFSRTAVDFCNRYFPWVLAYHACVTKMPFAANTFDRLCVLDVTEHLPFEYYIFFLFEAFRVLKLGGRMALLPGMTKREEHINLLPMRRIMDHLGMVGFKSVIVRPEWIIVEKPNEPR